MRSHLVDLNATLDLRDRTVRSQDLKVVLRPTAF
jgi:hypothetical protein